MPLSEFKNGERFHTPRSPAGLALFAGPSKAGKSWLTLWLCLQVAQGKPVWGREIEPRTVLYLSLEDTFNRL